MGDRVGEESQPRGGSGSRESEEVRPRDTQGPGKCVQSEETCERGPDASMQ